MSSLQTASLDEIREAAARICRDYLTGKWKIVTADQLIVKRVSGGLSNFLYYISLPEEVASPGATDDRNRNTADDDAETETSTGGDCNANKRLRTNSGGVSSAKLPQQREPREVLLRIYGQSHGEDALEAMITESVVFALLSERNFGPKLHGIFPGGRIEQFLPARPLATAELANYKISMKIAEKMGEIHSLNIPMSKEPDWLWNCMERWLKSIESILCKDDWKGDVAEQLEFVRSFDFYAEAKWLKSVIDEGSYPVLFCHNDMQEGNILLREGNDSSNRGSLSSLRSHFEDSAIVGLDDMTTLDANAQNANFEESESGKRKRAKSGVRCSPADLDCTRDSALSSHSTDEADPDLIIIDFEYCAYNYRGFDLANHFLEWTFDYCSNTEFPFFSHRKLQYPTKQQRQDFIDAYLKKLNEDAEDSGDYVLTATEVDSVEEEIRVFSMFSHLFWSLWSVVNVTSNIEFGYWEYAVTRIREYQSLKARFMTAEAWQD